MESAVASETSFAWLAIAKALDRGQWKESCRLITETLESITVETDVRFDLLLLLAYAQFRFCDFDASRAFLKECQGLAEGTTTPFSRLVECSEDFPIPGFQQVLWHYLSAELASDSLSTLPLRTKGVERLCDYLIGFAPFLPSPLASPFHELPVEILLSHASCALREGFRKMATRTLDLVDGLITFELSKRHRELFQELRRKAGVTAGGSWEERVEFAVDVDFFPTVEVPCLNSIKNSRPRLSICLPSFRSGDWLKITVDSILAHAEYDNFEILIALQDGSEKGSSTGDFLQSSVYRNDKRLRVFHYDNSLKLNSACYELGTQASGEILCFLNSSTIPSPGFARRAVNAFVRNTAVSVLAPAVTPLDKDNELGRPLLSDVTYDLSGLFSHTHHSKLPECRTHKFLYARPSVHSSVVFITADVFQLTGRLLLLLPTHPRAFQALARAAYFHGYQSYLPLNISCISKVTEELPTSQSVLGSLFPSENPELFKESVFLAFVFFSSEYFQYEFLRHLKLLSPSAVRDALLIVNENKELLQRSKRALWKRARRSQKHFWDQFKDEIVQNLSPTECARLLA